MDTHDMRGRNCGPSKRLDGKVALITGGSSGIGRATAKLFSTKGASIAINGRTEENLEAAADDIARCGQRPLTVQGDVSREADVKKIFKQTINTFEKIDILINSAGICRLGPIENFDPADWDEQMAVNVRGVFLCCREAANRMLAQPEGGQIINIASYMGIIGYPSVSAYCASKHAVMGLTRSLAKELQPMAIRVSAICPRQVDTKMRRDLFPEDDPSSWIPAREIAEGILFTATQSFMSGIEELTIGLPRNY